MLFLFEDISLKFKQSIYVEIENIFVFYPNQKKELVRTKLVVLLLYSERSILWTVKKGVLSSY